MDPKLTFWCVSYYLGAFGTLWLPYNTQCKTGQTGEEVRAMKSHRNFFATNAPNSPHCILNSCVWSVCYYLGAFATVWLPYKTRCSWDCLVGSQNLMVNVQNWCESWCPEVALEYFATNTPDPPHWSLNSCSGAFHTNFAAFGTVWLA